MSIPDCPACKGTGLVTIRPAERQFKGETHEQSCSCSRLATLRTPLDVVSRDDIDPSCPATALGLYVLGLRYAAEDASGECEDRG